MNEKDELGMQTNRFWWDGGFRAVHNQPREDLNPDGRAHVLTPHYRLDISRDRATPTAFVPVAPEEAEALLHGETAPAPSHEFTTALSVDLDGVLHAVDHAPSETRSLMVYDSGSVAQHLRLKGVALPDASGNPHPEAEAELVFVCWQDMVALTVRLVRRDNGLPRDSDARIILRTDGAPHPDMRPIPAGATTRDSDDVFVAEGNALHLHLGFGAFEAQPRVTARRAESDAPLPVGFDPLYAAHVVELAGYDGREPYGLRLRAETESADATPCRILLRREGEPRILPDGSANPRNPREEFAPGGSYPTAFDPDDGAPTGSRWQVSVDFHEFANYPRPHSRMWVRLYRQGTCRADAPLEEDVRLAWSDSWARPAAQFCQLSLLGWDDNPNYGGKRNHRAVQLWIQGVIRSAEITCLCPESYMCDNIVTDIRPVDQSHTWGPNLGGGDFARWRLAGEQPRRRMQAARADFIAYGPYLGTVRLHMTGEGGRIVGTTDAHILAANDISRTWFDCRYRVLDDMDLDELAVAFLGCPGYDFTGLCRYAWGDGSGVLHDAQVRDIHDTSDEWIDAAVEPGLWLAAYRGGTVDEQRREPNGNRGMVVRRAELALAEDDVRFAARRICVEKRCVATPQFHLHLRGDDGRVRLRAGDRFRIAWEYVPTLKYHTDSGHDAHCPVYREILREHPDSAAPVLYEARHGAWTLSDISGATAEEDAVFPTLDLDGETAAFTLAGGSGFTALRALTSHRPARAELFEKTGDGERSALVDDALAPPYQLHRDGDRWVTTFLLRGAPEGLDASPLRRRFRVLVGNG